MGSLRIIHVNMPAAKRMVRMPMNTPNMTIYRLSESATTATTLSREKARSANSTAMTTPQKPLPSTPLGSALILLTRVLFTQILKGEFNEIGCTQDLKIVIVDDKIGHNKHKTAAKISSKKSHLEGSGSLAAQDAVDWMAEEFEGAGPGYHVLCRKHGHQSTQNSRVIDGKDALQKDNLNDDINEIHIKLHQSYFSMGFCALVLHRFKNVVR